MIVGSGVTVTFAVADAIPEALAVTLAVWLACTVRAVTVTDALAAPPAKVKVAGTVAAPVLSELRLTVNPAAGACPPDRLSVRVPCAPEPTVRADGEKFIAKAETVTVPLPGV